MARTTIAQKLRDEVKRLQGELNYNHTKRIELGAKLERFEKEEDEIKSVLRRKTDLLEDQVQWLRNLVEKVVVKPEVQEMIVKAQSNDPNHPKNSWHGGRQY